MNYAERLFGCGLLRRYPHLDPILALDIFYAIFSSLKRHRFLDYQKDLYLAQGWKTFKADFLDKPLGRLWRTADSPGKWALKPLGTYGASSTDGDLWTFSRNLIKPYFKRAEYEALSRLDYHIDRLVEKIPSDGKTVDIQPLFQRWFLDNSTELLFGEPLHSQDQPQRFSIAQDMIEIMSGLRVRVQMTKPIFLHRDRAWFAAVNRVRAFMDKHIGNTLADLEAERKSGKKAVDRNGCPRTDLLYTVACSPDAQSLNREDFRSQVLNVLFSSNETTSILLSNVFFALARDERDYRKLREEILSYGGRSHLPYPISLQTIRVALNDTTLLVDSSSSTLPIIDPKGTIVNCNRYLMHRDPDYWGCDAETFLPERWETALPHWKFVRFGKGPRICPAHVLVDTECGYIIVKIVERMQALEERDGGRGYRAVMRAGPSSLYGVKVGFLE